MIHKPTALFAAAIAFSSLAAISTVFAEETRHSPQPAMPQGEMGDHAGMMNMMGHMSPDHLKHMTRMVDSCNRMMARTGHAAPKPHKAPRGDSTK